MSLFLTMVGLTILLASSSGTKQEPADSMPASPDNQYATQRLRMVTRQIANRGVTDSVVLDAMRTVPRHRFVPEQHRGEAYEDYPLPIGEDQTISQPYIVAVMTQILGLAPGDRVLEIGTGSGYQAAVLAEIVSQVYSIEIVESLGLRADSTLKALGYENVHVRIGDGYQGWPEQAPFDAIMVTAAPDHIPQPLVDQLAVGGRMVLPVGDSDQNLVLLRKTKDGVIKEDQFGVRFVPMTGEAENRK